MQVKALQGHDNVFQAITQMYSSYRRGEATFTAGHQQVGTDNTTRGHVWQVRRRRTQWDSHSSCSTESSRGANTWAGCLNRSQGDSLYSLLTGVIFAQLRSPHRSILGSAGTLPRQTSRLIWHTPFHPAAASFVVSPSRSHTFGSSDSIESSVVLLDMVGSTLATLTALLGAITARQTAERSKPVLNHPQHHWLASWKRLKTFKVLKRGPESSLIYFASDWYWAQDQRSRLFDKSPGKVENRLEQEEKWFLSSSGLLLKTNLVTETDTCGWYVIWFLLFLGSQVWIVCSQLGMWQRHKQLNCTNWFN